MGISRLGGRIEFAALRAAVRGAVLTSDDPGYHDARRVFNAAIDAWPAVIVQPASTADIAGTLTFASERGLSVSVRSGGHGVSGAAVSGEVVIDLTALHGVTVNPSFGTASVRGGTRWRELDAATLPHGLAVPGSRFSAVGVTGCALAGGDGWMSVGCGSTRRNVVLARVVGRDGRLRCDTPDRFGTDDGVIVSVTLRLHDIPQQVLGGMALYRLRDAAEVASIVNDFLRRGRPEFSPLVAFTSAPAARFVPGDVVGRPVLAVVPAWLGDPSEGAAFLARLRRVPTLADTVGATSYAELQTSLDRYFSPGLRASWSSLPIGTLTGGLVDDLADAAMAFPNRRTHVALTPSADSTWTVQLMAQWSNAVHDAAQASWAASVAARLSASDSVHRAEGVVR